ncbi:putative phosphatase [metagenome]|uniref:Putative phosphatase n=1 Tax=metagenome TaxID=256318 RepID=A0A2P2CEJ4_9ZZZZ
MSELWADALLFDSDGVLVDSDAAVLDAWDAWAVHWDLDPAVVGPLVHGTPSRQTISRFIDPLHQAEALTMIDRMELETISQVQALPGAVELLSGLAPGSWAIVTSGTSPLALGRLRAAGVPVPAVVVTADDVPRGKPHPEPYLLAASSLGTPPGRCLVFEDAPAGIASARAARVGHVVGVNRRNDGVDAFVEDLRSVSVSGALVRLAGTPG